MGEGKQTKRFIETKRLRLRYNSVNANVLRLWKQFGHSITGYNGLVMLYWLHIDKARISLEDLKRLTSAQTIERSLRLLIAAGLIPVPPWLRRRRQQEQTHRYVL